MKISRLAPLLLTLGVLATAGETNAQYWPHDFFFPEDPIQVMFTADYDLFVATVASVDDSLATQGDPPRISLEVEEVLYGLLPLGPSKARWMPWQPYIPCGVGESGNIRRWNATPMQGPTVGSRLILAGPMDPNGWLVIRPKYVWTYSDSLRDALADSVRAWMPRITERRRLEAEARAAKEAARLAEEARQATERARLEAATASWIKHEQSVTRKAPLRDLVAMATDIVVGEVSPIKEPGPWLPNTHYVELDVREWLLHRDADTLHTSKRIRIYLGAWEDSVARRWQAARHPGELGWPENSPPLLAVAFLRHANDAWPSGNPPLYRSVDPNLAILVADERFVRRVRWEAAASRMPNPMPRDGCGARIDEFVHPSPEDLAGIRIKISVVEPSFWLGRRTFVLSCAGDAAGTGLLAPCIAPDNRYHNDYYGVWHERCSPQTMQAMLEALARLDLTEISQAGTADTFALAIGGSLRGRNRYFEIEMNYERLLAAYGAIYAATQPEERVRRKFTWWAQLTSDRMAQEIYRRGQFVNSSSTNQARRIP